MRCCCRCRCRCRAGCRCRAAALPRSRRGCRACRVCRTRAPLATAVAYPLRVHNSGPITSNAPFRSKTVQDPQSVLSCEPPHLAWKPTSRGRAIGLASVAAPAPAHAAASADPVDPLRVHNSGPITSNAPFRSKTVQHPQSVLSCEPPHLAWQPTSRGSPPRVAAHLAWQPTSRGRATGIRRRSRSGPRRSLGRPRRPAPRS